MKDLTAFRYFTEAHILHWTQRIVETHNLFLFVENDKNYNTLLLSEFMLWLGLQSDPNVCTLYEWSKEVLSVQNNLDTSANQYIFIEKKIHVFSYKL